MVSLNSEFAGVEEIIKLASSVKSPLVSIAELVKNGADAGAKDVVVEISKRKNKVSISDNGNGFSNNDIQHLHRIYYSNKKKKGNLTNKQNEYFAGSKGLGLFSAFFLGRKIEINTDNLNFSYTIKWSRDEMPIIEKKPTTGKIGTEIVIRQIYEEKLNHLLKEKELKKFQFVSLGLYNSKSKLPKIKLLIDGKQIERLAEIENVVNHKIKVNFSYNKTTKKLNFQYIAFKREDNFERENKRKKINRENLVLDLTESNEDIYKCIQEHYRFDYSNRRSKKLNYQIDEKINEVIDSWPSFEGEYWIEEGIKTDKVKEFGYGVKLYVNNYALYDYLNSEFDWLGLSNISDNYVSNAFKLRNVFGYVNFQNFDENTEEIEISDERGGFLESTALENIMLGIRNFITYLAININVVMRSSDFGEQDNKLGELKENSEEELSGALEESQEKDISGELQETREEDTLGDEGENSEEKILKQKQKTLKYGQTWNIYDPQVVYDGVTSENTSYTVSEDCSIKNHIFVADKPGKFIISYFNNSENLKKEELNIIVQKRKKTHKKKGKIFNDTEVVVGDLYLDELHDIVKEVASLDYTSYPLLSSMSLRVVLEDLLKKECVYSEIRLTGSLAKNFENVINSFIDRIEIRKGDPKKAEIEELHKEFRGRDALKNLLNLWKDDSERITNSLNYNAHNPIPILSNEQIYNCANSILVPLGHLISSAKEKRI